jgi:hypothetical protein
VEAGSFDGRRQLLAGLRQKAGRYGISDVPFVIAVLQETVLPGNDDIFHALFGSRRLAIPLNNEDAARLVLGDDGFWRAPKGVQNNRTTGVLFAQNLNEWNIATQAPDLWLSPQVDNPLGDMFPWRGHRINGEGGIDTSEPKMQPNELFLLPEEWPGPEGPFEV